MPSNMVVGLLRPFPAGFAKGAYRSGPGLRPPVLQHTAPARYPDEGPGDRPAVVEVLAVIDEEGDVNARVLVAPEPRAAFEREALAAVRKYVFEPGAIEGRAVPVVATLVVDFRPPGIAPPAIRVIGGTADPPPGVATRLSAAAEPSSRQLLRPLPIEKLYPELDEDTGATAGRVEMLVAVNAAGSVHDLEVTRPLDPAVDRIALECVRQWKFEPAIKGGRPTPVYFSAFISVNERSL